MRNKRISSKRSPVERFYAFIKCVCKAGHVAVTTIPRLEAWIWTNLVSCSDGSFTKVNQKNFAPDKLKKKSKKCLEI